MNMKRLAMGIWAVLASVAAAAAEPTAQEQMDELKREIDRLLEAAPTGPHGGKVVSPEIKALMDRRSGGVVVPKTNGKTFLVVDARGAGDDFRKGYCTALERNLHLGMTVVAKPPPPTNAIQRAIWEKVHQIPDKPIKIEFDPKKDK